MFSQISIATYVSFILLFASIKITRAFYQKTVLFNPLFIFFSVWCFSLILYDFDAYFHYFYLRMDMKADIWLSIALVCFFIGGILPFFLIKKNQPTVKIINPLTLKTLWYINSILFSLFFIAVMWKIKMLTERYNGLLSSFYLIKQNSFYGEFKFPLLLYFFTLPAYLLIINLGILTILSKSKKALLLGICTLFLAFLDASTVGMRGEFLNFSLLFVCSIMITFIASEKGFHLRHYFLTGCTLFGVLCVLAFSLYLRGNTTLTEALFKHSFLYIVGTIPAYSYFLSHPWPSHYWGMWTFYGVYHAINRLSVLSGHTFYDQLATQTFYAPIINSPYNSTNFLVYIFSDFGFAGLIIIPFLLGLIANYFFIRVLQNKNLVDIQLLTLILVGLILSIRGMLTNGVFCWALLLLILIQSLILKKINKST